MKRLIICIVFLTLFVGCEEEEDPNAGTGCLTAYPKAGAEADRFTIRCCTRQEFLAGSNVSAGGTANWTLYAGHKWEKCSDCN